MERLLLLIVGMLLGVAGFAQGVEFQATTDARSLVENAVFEVSFTLKNADGERFTPPPFKDFQVVAGPSRGMSTTIINGRVSKSQSFTYVLQATQTGKFSISPASIYVNGRKLVSNSLDISVVGAGEGGGGGNTIIAPDDTDVFVVAETDTNVVYPGQQVHLRYVLYSRINVRNYNVLSEDDYDKYYLRYVTDFSRRSTREVINGVQYTRQILKTLALFPQQVGVDTIDPFQVRLGIGVSDPNSGMFFSMRTIPKVVQTNPVVLEVRPLPDNAPAEFTGAVGRYQMQARIDNPRISTDDALVLSVLIRGDGDARRWNAPEGESLFSDFEVYEPKTISDRSVDQSGMIVNEKRFEYQLIPRRTGQIQFQFPFSYFDPDSAKYVSLESGNFIVNVTQGARQAGDLSVIRDVNGPQMELRPLRPADRIGVTVPAFFLSVPYFTGLALPAIAFLVVFLQRRKETAFLQKSEEEKRRIQASSKARTILAEAEKCMKAQDPKGFYSAVAQAVIGYLATKLGIAQSSLTRSNLEAEMRRHHLDPDFISRVMEKIAITDRALYSGMSQHSDMDAFYREMTDLLVDMESRLEQG